MTSATTVTSFPYARSDEQSLLLIARISKLIERVCDGEEANEKIFDDFTQALYLIDDIYITSIRREALELYLVLRIMNLLGYIGESELLSDYLSTPFDQIEIEVLLKERQSIIAHINKALNESQL